MVNDQIEQNEQSFVEKSITDYKIESVKGSIQDSESDPIANMRKMSKSEIKFEEIRYRPDKSYGLKLGKSEKSP